MSVLIVIGSALVTFIAILFGLYVLRSKLGLQDYFKREPCCDDFDQMDDSLAHSRKPWPIENDGETESSEKVESKKTSTSEHKTKSSLHHFPYLDQIVNLSDDHPPPDSTSDPVEYCAHLQREIKKTKQRVALEKIKSEMTKEQREMEREVQRRQLEDIFRMMEEQKEKFGMSSVDDIRQQMRLYLQ